MSSADTALANTQRCGSLDAFPPHAGRVHLAIGMFDGVHLGHQAVIEAAVRAAHRENAKSAVLTFHPHPSRLFHPDSPTRLIMSSGAQFNLFAGLGVDVVIQQPFTSTFAAISAADFAPYLQAKIPSLAVIYVGRNFRFGSGRKGDVNQLVRSARPLNIRVYSAPRVTLDGLPISSTRIREALIAGEIVRANAMLGQNYTSGGQVVSGKQAGRKLGFPTLNLPHDPELRPRFGVYAVRVQLEGEAGWLPAVANYGLRPTLEDNAAAPLLEIHLLQAKEIPAGTGLQAEWLDFIRAEKKFPSVEALREAIAADVEQVKEFFKRQAF